MVKSVKTVKILFMFRGNKYNNFIITINNFATAWPCFYVPHLESMVFPTCFYFL